MFGNKELQKEVERLSSLNEAHEVQAKEFEEKIEALKGFEQSNIELTEANDRLAKELEEFRVSKVEMSEKIEELEEKSANVEEKISNSAVNLVAQIGHEPVEVPQEDDSMINVEEKYMSIKDPKQKLEYFKENKSKLYNKAFK